MTRRNPAPALGLSLILAVGAGAQPAPSPTPPPIIPAKDSKSEAADQPGTAQGNPKADPQELPAKGAKPGMAPNESLFPENLPLLLPGEKPRIPRGGGLLRPRSGRRIPLRPEMELESSHPEDEELPGVAPSLEPPPKPPEEDLDLIQRTGLEQAVSTAEAVLGNFGNLPGTVNSPFLVPRRPQTAPHTRIGKVDLRPHIGIGVMAIDESGATTTQGSRTDGILQGGFHASIEKPKRYNAWLQYDFGYVFPKRPGDTDELETQNDSSSGNNGSGSNSSSSNGEDNSSGNSTDNSSSNAKSNSGRSEKDHTSSNGGSGGFDQRIALMLNVFLTPKITLGLSANYASLSGVNRDAGGDAERILGTTSFSVRYAYSRKTTFDWSLSVPLSQFSGGINTEATTSSYFVTNQVTKKTAIGLGLTQGWIKAEPNTEDPSDSLQRLAAVTEMQRVGIPRTLATAQVADDGSSDNGDTMASSDGAGDSMQSREQTFLRPTVRLHYAPTAFVTIHGDFGVEFRESEHKSSTTPVFGLGAVWTPGPDTSVSLAAERRTFTSVSALDSDFISTSFVFEVRHRLFSRLTGVVGVGYELAEYESAGDSGTQETRKDKLFSISGGLTFQITDRWTCSLTSGYAKNKSDLAGFKRAQTIFQTTYSF